MTTTTKISVPAVRVDRALQHFGNDRKALARYFGITAEAVMNWERGLVFLPKLRALQISIEHPELIDGAAPRRHGSKRKRGGRAPAP